MIDYKFICSTVLVKNIIFVSCVRISFNNIIFLYECKDTFYNIFDNL